MVKLGIELVPQQKIDKIVEYIKEAEANNFDFAWITDHYNNRNTYVTLALAAVQTSKIRLGTGVTNPFLVNPAVTASAIASIHEVSNGRAILGIGAGDATTLKQLGVEWSKPLTAVQETITIAKKLWAGETVKFEGEVFKIKSARLNFKNKFGPIPVYVGAQGPKMLELAATLGDGALINASHPIDLEPATTKLKETLSLRDNSQEFDIAAYTSFSLADTEQEARKLAAPVVTFIVAATPAIVLERHEIPEADVNKLRELLGKGKITEAFAAVTDEMIDAFSICGTKETVTEKMIDLKEIGVSQIVIGSPIADDKSKAIKTIGNEILPLIKE
ncbi:MAG: 5,10-methylenetetrahydromethanopterin reductase [Candidatus Jordarchaeaceae archaeon]